MPLYEYECSTCGRRLEMIQRVDDPPPSCGECGVGMRKLLSAPAFQFKGSGWYVTDYARKGAGGTAKAATSAEGDAKSSGGDAATGGSEGKPDTKTPAKSSGGKGE